MEQNDSKWNKNIDAQNKQKKWTHSGIIKISSVERHKINWARKRRIKFLIKFDSVNKQVILTSDYTYLAEDT